MLRKGIMSSRGFVRGRPKKRFVDSGAVKNTGSKETKKPSVSVQTCNTTPEEDKKFIDDMKKEFQSENSDFIPEVEPLVEEAIPELEPEPEVEETPEMYEPEVDSYYVVIDFEATCFKGKYVPRSEMEIIEFAAVLVDKKTLLPVDEFDMFVRPSIHPQLDAFCTELTSITQEQVDNGFSFSTVLRQFTNWMQQYSGAKTFCSWGDYDKAQLIMDCNRHGLEYPFDEDHLNIKKLFSRVKGYKRKYGVGSALKQLKMEFEGTPHRGIDDTRNIVRIMQQILTEPS